MMENNKYYTPDITEFCIGFECEYYNKHSKNWLPMLVEESNYYVDYIGGPEEDYIFKGNYVGHDKTFRVKFLDQTDIEDCGFKHTGRAVCKWYKIEKRIADGFSTYGYWNIITLIHCEDNKVKIFAQEYETGDEHTLFQGEIKNKHELKKLMQQLNII